MEEIRCARELAVCEKVIDRTACRQNPRIVQ
jgi:hypothetical protein